MSFTRDSVLWSVTFATAVLTFLAGQFNMITMAFPFITSTWEARIKLGAAIFGFVAGYLKMSPLPLSPKNPHATDQADVALSPLNSNKTIGVLLFILLLPTSSEAARPYHVETVASLATSRHTHVEVTGKVTLRKREADGDWHIRISDGRRFVVAEIIPTLSKKDPATEYVGGDEAMGFQLPKIGDCVRVRGIRRIDNEAGHGWSELHPVEQLAIVPCP